MSEDKQQKPLTIHEILSKIQCELKAPKDMKNTFGGYNYRSNEMVLELLKPLLGKYGVYITQNDSVVFLEGRFYIKAESKIHLDKDSISSIAYARECDAKKGMDEAQITGATSSYARKYSLNGLFAIDDNKDADATNDHGKATKKPTKSGVETKPKSGKGSSLSLAAKAKAVADPKLGGVPEEKPAQKAGLASRANVQKPTGLAARAKENAGIQMSTEKPAPAKNTPLQQKRANFWNMLIEMYDREGAASRLAELTVWVDPNTGEIKREGFTDPGRLTGPQLTKLMPIVEEELEIFRQANAPVEGEQDEPAGEDNGTEKWNNQF